MTVRARRNNTETIPSHFQHLLFPFHHLQVDDIKEQQDESLEISLSLIEEPPLRCAVCGSSADGIHRKLTRKVRDLNINGKKVYLKRPYRYIICGECDQIRSQQLKLTRRKKQVSNRYTWYIQVLDWRGIDLNRIATSQDMAWKTVKSLVNEPVPDIGQMGNNVVLAIDVIERNRGLLEMVFIDYNSGRYIDSVKFLEHSGILDWVDEWAALKRDILIEKNVFLMSELPEIASILTDRLPADAVLTEVADID